jgi:hypothetical protein
MAEIKHLVDINLNGNQLQNASIHPLGAAPTASLQAGRIYFDTSPSAEADYRLKVYSGSTGGWLEVGDPVYDSTVTITAGTLLSFGTNETGTFTLNQSADKAFTINHDSVTATATAGTAVTLGFGGSFNNISTSYTSEGHVDTVTTTSVTLPSLGTTSTTALAGDTTVDDISNANLLTRLAALESAGGAADQNITIGADSGDTIVITGNLTVSGTTTTVNSETINLADNIITLNSNIAGNVNPTQNAGLEVLRGNESDVLIYWNESTDKWMIDDGTAKVIATEGDITLGTDTIGDYVATITGSTGIDSSAATSGEGTTHSLTLDLNELTAATGIVSLAGVGASNVTQKFPIATVVAEILSDSSASTTVGDDTETVFYIDHGLSSNKVIVQLYDASGNTVIAEVRRGVSDGNDTASNDHIKVSFNVAPASDEQITVLIQKVA